MSGGKENMKNCGWTSWSKRWAICNIILHWYIYNDNKPMRKEYEITVFAYKSFYKKKNEWCEI